MTVVAPRRGLTLLAALFVAALALRPQLVGVGPLLPDIQDDLGVSHAVAGLLGTIPVLCMGVFAPAAARIAAPRPPARRGDVVHRRGGAVRPRARGGPGRAAAARC